MWKRSKRRLTRTTAAAGAMDARLGRRRRAAGRCRGLSLIEVLVTLPIVAMLLTATMVAIDASFKAYGSAAEQAATQAATRMVVHRLLTLIRTSTAHGPLEPSAGPPAVTISDDLLTSSYVELIDSKGRLMRVEYRSDVNELWLVHTPANGGAVVEQPLISGVESATFHCKRRRDADGLWVLERATLDLTVVPSDDATLEIENGGAPAVRAVASTMPRKLD